MRTLSNDRLPDPRKRKGPPVPENKRKTENGIERVPSGDTSTFSDTHPSGEERRVITNTDEQNQVTNAEHDAMNETEREGV